MLEHRDEWVNRIIKRVAMEEFIRSTLVFIMLVYSFNLITIGVNYYAIVFTIVIVFIGYYRLTMRKGKYGYLQKGRESYYGYSKGLREVWVVKVAPRGLIPLKREAFNQGIVSIVIMEVIYLVSNYFVEGVYMKIIVLILVLFIVGLVSKKRMGVYKPKLYNILSFNNTGQKLWLTDEESNRLGDKEGLVTREDLKEELSQEEQEEQEELEEYKGIKVLELKDIKWNKEITVQGVRIGVTDEDKYGRLPPELVKTLKEDGRKKSKLSKIDYKKIKEGK